MSDIFKIYDRNLYKIGVPLYSDDLSTYQVVSSSEGRINPDQINSGTTVEQQQQYLGALIAGKLDFTNDDNGYILGIDKGVPKFYIGNSEDYLNWNGTELILSGTISASAGIIGGFTITENSLYATTTGAIKTSATVGAGSDGVIIDKDGLKMYDSILGIVVNFPSDGSAPTFSSGTINSTAFNINTNAAIRTSETVGDGTSDSYGILINNTGLYACQANQTLANANVKILIDGSVSITGTINANAGKIGSSTNYWSIGAKGITATSSNGDVIINYGKTDFGSATSGFILGYDYSSSKAKFELGDATNYLNWNGSTLSISGSISATSGTIGGFTISANALYAGTGVTRIQLDTSQGIFLGANTLATSPFSVTLSGALSATSGTIGGCALAETSIGSTLFVSGPLGSGWNISNTGIAEFQNATVRGIIRTSVFEKDTISAVNGMMLISSADVLDSDMTSLDNSTLTIKGETTFVANEVIRIKDGTDDEWMLVTNAASAPVYTVTRDLAGSYSANTNPVWKKGTAVVSMGVGTGTKTGFVLIDSSSANSPYIDIYGRNSNTYNDYTLHGRFGWLKGITNTDVGLATTDVWGLYTDNAYIKGVIVADSGKIGGTSGWSISAGSISSVNGGNTTTMASGGTNAYIAGTTGSPEFIVTHTGALTASSAVITGAITTGAGSSISADYLTTGTITSKTITLAVSAGTGDTYIAAGKTDFTNIDAGFILGLDDSDDDKAKFYIGNSTYYLNWDGSGLTLKPQYSNLQLYETIVDAAGHGDYLLLSDAIAAGKKKIFIRSGSYTETATINITSNTMIEGEDKDGVIITFNPSSNDTLLNVSNYSIKQNNTILIKNISFTTDATYNNICLEGSGRYINIKDCIFYGWTDIAVSLYSGSFYIGESEYVDGWYTVEYCNFYNNEVQALSIAGNTLSIKNNQFRNNYTSATTRLNSSLDIFSAYSIIADNRFDNEVGGAIIVAGFMNNISDNIILTCGATINDAAGISTPYDTVGWTASLNNISKNIIRYCPIGIYYGTSGGNICYQTTISENIISSCRRGGIKIEYANYNRILGNQLNANTTDGDNTYSEIIIDNSDNVTIANNMVLCASSSSINAQYGLRLTSGSNTCIVTGNHIYNAQTANLSDAGTSNDINHNIAP